LIKPGLIEAAAYGLLLRGSFLFPGLIKPGLIEARAVGSSAPSLIEAQEQMTLARQSVL
jgi:hypothetical protein